MSYLGPAQTMERYGMASDALANGICRSSGVWQMCAAATMLHDEETILDKAFIPVIAAMLLYIPGITEVKGGIPKEPLVAWLGVHVVLAKLAASGKVNKWVAPALYFLMAPKHTSRPHKRSSSTAAPRSRRRAST